MVNSFELMQHVTAVENYLALEGLFILKYVLVLNEYYNHIHLAEELVEARVLVLCNLVPFKKWIVAAERTCEMTLLCFEYLESRRLAIVIYILLVCKTIETHLTVVSDAVLLHNLVDAVKNKSWLRVVGLH